MADTLTQLQDRLDQLNTQLYASIQYISTHHSFSPLPNPTPQPSSQPPSTQQPNPSQPSTIVPSSAPALPNGQAPSPPPPSTNTNTQSTTQQTTSFTPGTQPTTQSTAPPSQPPPPQTLNQTSHLDPSDHYPPTQRPDSPTTFALAQKELAHDLIFKTKQIEGLIKSLPGVERGQMGQEARIADLEEELKARLREREEVEEERRDVLERVEELICGVGN